MSFFTLLSIGCGGFLGAVFRAYINGLVSKIFQNPTLPLGTLSVNLIGGFFIGFILSIASTYSINQNLKSFLITGFLGGLTTFSTFTYENMLLINSNSYFMAFANIGLNVALCLVFCYIGLFAAKLLIV
ncbi:CrcB protein [Campylobacter hyointestinalis subsp. hyointestinalis]|uniref:Fluoride-specific ion channel FluC n=1 Tax=Campylobacter hyointestinalis subsp. hyointestinalis TaxID=91352 RepID=A0A0S4R7M7_CAMHY|nr:fluoride efflux transporter CrcB [Campylobacter hyointestinalis]PPB54171.1 chromosome condensation protein CrcB [Campylobacter hyointestinalis subsp. hyointestinalis]PPB60972.1 chromosome condensation protein CrcB [Campylobacter hyointestinalis subsp. hyointestinalis]PPB62812.1 chromosome condensation protein CrcB [Campylobacter hyointestinalis subsp. hyointestinalis]CUU70086.1 CrcB protein [Campylobacter hyointestinalis subsp. hyointestinalis]CUU73582.1 CrcB protein [Campylobacter hyointes